MIYIRREEVNKCVDFWRLLLVFCVGIIMGFAITTILYETHTIKTSQ